MAEMEKESLKKHGDTMEPMTQAAEPQKGAERQSGEAVASASGERRDPIPIPEDGGHERSHAAHLGGHVHEQTKAADKLKQGVSANTLREPPMVVQRVGKQHR